MKQTQMKHIEQRSQQETHDANVGDNVGFGLVGEIVGLELVTTSGSCSFKSILAPSTTDPTGISNMS